MGVCCKKQAKFYQEKNLVVDEKLDPFWNSINGIEQKRWFAKETYFRNNYNIKTIDNRAYESLKNEKRGDQVIFDAINYDILSNLRYADQFFYTQLDKRGDNDFEFSDYVARVIYLGEDRCTESDLTKSMKLKKGDTMADNFERNLQNLGTFNE